MLALAGSTVQVEVHLDAVVVDDARAAGRALDLRQAEQVVDAAGRRQIVDELGDVVGQIRGHVFLLEGTGIHVWMTK